MRDNKYLGEKKKSFLDDCCKNLIEFNLKNPTYCDIEVITSGDSQPCQGSDVS